MSKGSRATESQGSSMALEILGASSGQFAENCRDFNSNAWVLAPFYFTPEEKSTNSFLFKKKRNF